MFLFVNLLPMMIFASAATNAYRIRRQVSCLNSTFDGLKTKQMCDGYSKKACNEILPSERSSDPDLESILSNLTEFIDYGINIVGGTPSKPKEFPHMALVGIGEYSKVRWICGGSLISKNYILSAAHCTKHSKGQPTWIRLGELNSTSTDDDATTVDYPIINSTVHPDYKHPYVYNDIALFKFEGLSSFTEYIRPICLNIFYNIPDYRKFIAVGWGSQKFGGNRSDQLRSVELDLINDEKCSLIFDGDKLLPYGFDNQTMLCVGYLAGGKDTCQGDSGGPLQILNNESVCSEVPIYTQIGITSFGVKDCGLADVPGVYTRVSYFIPWIESIVWN